MWGPVILELPPDAPFDEATYIDPLLDEQSISSLKAKSHMNMNVFYKQQLITKQGSLYPIL